MPTVLAEKNLISLPSTDVVDLTDYELFAGRKRWTRTSCEFLERVGELSERYELIDGEIIVKMGHSRLHATAVMVLMRWLYLVFGTDFTQCQLPIEVAPVDQPTNQPEPDASVLALTFTNYAKTVPGRGDLRLVVEVSDTSLAQDLRIKSLLYAGAEIPEYWVVDAPGRRIIVHREPLEGIYRDVIAYNEDDTITALSAPATPVVVTDLLPPI